MKPASFTHHRPDSVDTAVSLLETHDSATLLAGNQSLGIAMAKRQETPDHLIDLNGIDELAYIETTADAVTIGAMTRHRTIERSDRLAKCLPLLPDAGGKIAGPSVRNRGTIGGSLGNADPAANFPAALTALGGTITLRSTEGSRTVDADAFFIDDGTTACRADELIESVSVPREPFPADRTGMAFVRLKRVAQKWPIVSAATAIRVDDPGADTPIVDAARIALSNTAPVPLRVPEAESILAGNALTDSLLEDVAAVVMDATDPIDEMHADPAYRRDVAGEYTRRSLEQSYARARGIDEADVPWTEH